MIKKLRHIGVMVEDFERAVEKFKKFGLPCTEVKEVKQMDLLVGFLPVGETSIEIVCHTEPDKGDDPMTTMIRGQKGAINHICLEVDNLEATIRDFERSGAKVAEGCPRPGAHGRIAFFYPETTEGVLIELCEV